MKWVETRTDNFLAAYQGRGVEGEVELALASVWSEVLRVERVGVHDNIIELGGDSILSIQVVARAADGTIVTKGQDTAGAFPSEWTTIGTLTAPISPKIAVAFDTLTFSSLAFASAI